MTRAIPAALLTALTQEAIEPFYAIEMLFDDTDGTSYNEAGYQGNRALRLWTGYGDRTISSATYIGAGEVINISGLEETSDLSAKGATVTFNGIDTDIMTLALSEPYQSRKARILFGEASVSDTIEVFSGLMDVMSIEHSGDTVNISMAIESKLITLQRANIRRYTSENHKLRHPGDTFFDFVSDLQDKSIQWGPERYG